MMNTVKSEKRKVKSDGALSGVNYCQAAKA